MRGRSDVDFAVGGMLKYLLGTAGIGFLYVRSELIRELVPSNSGWFAQQDIAAMDITANRPVAKRPALRGRHAARGQLLCRGGRAEDHPGDGYRCDRGACPVVDAALHGGTGCDRLAGRDAADDARRGPMVAVPARDAAGLFARLLEQDIVTSFRDNNIRATIHFYNSADGHRPLRRGHGRPSRSIRTAGLRLAHEHA